MNTEEFIDREWIIEKKATMWSNSLLLQKVILLLSTRTDEPIDFIPEKLFSSLKYQINIEVTLGSSIEEKRNEEYPNCCLNGKLYRQAVAKDLSSGLKEEDKDIPNIILADIDVINCKTGELVYQKKGDGNRSVLKGETHLSLQPKKQKNKITEEVVFESKTKLQFNEVSYHNQKETFSMRVSFYTLSSYQTKEPIIVYKSAPFLLYSRRTNDQRKEEGKKRKRYIEQRQTLPLNNKTNDTKKVKLTEEETQEILLAEYMKELKELMLLRDKLNKEEETLATSTALRVLVDKEEVNEIPTSYDPFAPCSDFNFNTDDMCKENSSLFTTEQDNLADILQSFDNSDDLDTFLKSTEKEDYDFLPLHCSLSSSSQEDVDFQPLFTDF
ncbi:hypothetical protein ABK040_010896 [Willaertia magna]